jgi:glycosyltransferase involved in cell wall biosynthesis
MTKEAPLLSVCLITYNHASFIRQAMDGVLMQKVNFHWEFIIADDHSTDGNTEILLEYKKKHPDLIHLILQKKNVGPARNWLDLIAAPKGKYIAYFEGDDYWTDPGKLQKQVDFLMSNPDFAICFHNSKIIYEEHPDRVSYSNGPSQPTVSTFEDLAKGEFIYTATGIFRRNDFNKYPKKFNDYLNNYTLDLHNAQYGKINYINEVMSVYRVHKGGIWSMVSREKTLIDQLPTYKFYLNYFPKKHRHFFVEHLKNMTSELISVKMANKSYKDFWKYYIDYCFYNIQEKGAWKNILYAFLKANRDTIRQVIKR